MLWVTILIKYYCRAHFSAVIVLKMCHSFTRSEFMLDVQVLKSGYPDYLKCGFTQTIWPTENWCPKSGYPNTLYLEHFHHFSLHFYQYVPLGTFLYGKKSTKNRKKIILGRRICAPMQQCKNHKENDERGVERLLGGKFAYLVESVWNPLLVCLTRYGRILVKLTTFFSR